MAIGTNGNLKIVARVSESSVDNSAAIQSAVAAAKAAGGGTVYIPAGTYIVSGAAAGGITLNGSGVQIEGAGRGVTILKLANSATDQGAAIQVADYSDGTIKGTIEWCAIRNLSIDGNKANQQAGSGASNGINSGIVVEDAVATIIENVEIYDCDGYGILLSGSHLPHRANCLIRNFIIRDCYYDAIDIKAGFNGALIEGPFWIYNCKDGPITSRDAMGIDIRGKNITVRGPGTIGQNEAGTSQPNKSGGIRVRGNASSDIILDDVSCYDAASGTYNFYFNGLNNGLVSCKGCLSRGGQNGFRIARGHVTLDDCTALDASAVGVSASVVAESAITTTAESVTVATGSQTVDIADATNLAIDMYIRITDSTNWVEGIITALDNVSGTNTLTINVLATNGTGPIASGEDVVVRNIGSVTIKGGLYTRNAQDGGVFDTTPYPVHISGGARFDYNDRYGVRAIQNQLIMVGSSAKGNGINNAAKRGIQIDGGSEAVVISGNDLSAGDVFGGTQTHSVRFDNAPTGNIYIDGNIGAATFVSGTTPGTATISNTL